MNELDSELVRGQLSALGYRFTEDPAAAEIVLFNTCSVRDQAEQKVRSRVGIVAAQKREGRSVVLGLLGCMAEREGLNLLRQHPHIDLLCGPGQLDRLPLLLDNLRRTSGSLPTAERAALSGNTSRRTATLAAAEDGLEALDLSRSFDPQGSARPWSAYVRITRGCNKFCTYCVVPATRGAEVHRPPDAIVEECRRLVEGGVIEITLLGQTVNHYRYSHGLAMTIDGREAPQIGPGLSAFRNSTSDSQQTTTFAQLLRRIHDEIPELPRLRFVTSYPRDLGDDVMAALAECPRICRYLHMPAQSGSDRMLRAMNRGYTVSEYLETVERAVASLPDVTIAGDIIVGFPGETDEDFAATEALLRRVPFKNNFIFKYSPRPGTVAFDRLEDDVPDEVKRARNNRLLDLQSEVSRAVHAGWVGRRVGVLFDRAGRAPEPKPRTGNVELRWQTADTDAHARVGGTWQACGRTPGDLIVAVECPDESTAQGLVGTIAEVEVLGSGPLLLRAALANSERPTHESIAWSTEH